MSRTTNMVNYNKLLNELDYNELNQDDRELADCIGFESFKRLVSVYGGLQINIKLPATICTKARNKLIRKQFNGGNYNHLARIFGISESTVRRIVSEREERSES